MTELEKYFLKYRKNIIGIDKKFVSPFGEKTIVYADWMASGRLYAPIEKILTEEVGPMIGNTHSEASETGMAMTGAYHEARCIIKQHVNAGKSDVIIFCGYGMTAAINKLHRIMGLKAPEQLQEYINFPKEKKPVVFLTHMEHHSNQTSWLETICDVVVLEPNEKGLVDLNTLEENLRKYSGRRLKIGSFTAGSNVTGIQPDYHAMAKLMHRYGGLCFVDFAAAAPYVEINMHPADEEEKLDAVFFSPHKFLGGPGSPGVLVFDSSLYNLKVPDQPGGGTVDWTNPWGGHKYIQDIETREDGGTPGFLQAIKAGFAAKLKDQIGVKNIEARERELLRIAFPALKKNPSIHILADEVEERFGVISFYVENLHYNLVVKLLNDRFGIQVRGGCSCAGTYGHYLLHVDPTRSQRITDKINQGDLSEKPGWVRLSLHPTMTNDELEYVLQSIDEVIQYGEEYGRDYEYLPHQNEFAYTGKSPAKKYDWFNSL